MQYNYVMKCSLREECIPSKVKTRSCTDVKMMMKCTQNLQNIAGDQGWNDLLYKLRQGKFELLVVVIHWEPKENRRQ